MYVHIYMYMFVFWTWRYNKFLFKKTDFFYCYEKKCFPKVKETFVSLTFTSMFNKSLCCDEKLWYIRQMMVPALVNHTVCLHRLNTPISHSPLKLIGISNKCHCCILMKLALEHLISKGTGCMAWCHVKWILVFCCCWEFVREKWKWERWGDFLLAVIYLTFLNCQSCVSSILAQFLSSISNLVFSIPTDSLRV